MSVYKSAIDRVRNHPGYLSSSAFETKFLLNAETERMIHFIKRNGCLITSRHDINPKFSGRDFLFNVMSDLVVLHVSTTGDYSLHQWDKGKPCSESNRLTRAKENLLLTQLLLLNAA